jgi:hypothetical protein
MQAKFWQKNAILSDSIIFLLSFCSYCFCKRFKCC